MIAPDLVLTAAHCLETTNHGELHVWVNADRADEKPRVVGVADLSIMSDFANTDPPDGIGRIHNDVALIRLARPLAKTKVLALATKSPKPGSKGVIYGRGSLGPSSTDLPNTLRRASIKVRPAEVCRTAMAGLYQFEPDQQVCLTGLPSRPGTRTIACTMDSGSALIDKDDKLAGVASYLDRKTTCDDPTAATMAYADVAHFRDWALGTPTWAPRALGSATVSGELRAGHTLTCVAPRVRAPRRQDHLPVVDSHAGRPHPARHCRGPDLPRLR